MPENLEIKASIVDVNEAVRAAQTLGAHDRGELRQVDTYFNVAHGRLKLREVNGVEFELVFYDREENALERLSHFDVIPVQHPGAISRVLGSSLGILGRVVKRRRLFQYKSTRIHVDEVSELGSFLEFETAVLDSQREASNELNFLVRHFHISTERCILQSYIDLLIARREGRNPESSGLLEAIHRGAQC